MRYFFALVMAFAFVMSACTCGTTTQNTPKTDIAVDAHSDAHSDAPAFVDGSSLKK